MNFTRTPFTDGSSRSSSRWWRSRPRTVALAVLATAALGGTAVGPAQAMLVGDGGGGRSPGAGPSKPKLVRVYRSTYAYSTPYLNARRRHPVRPGAYVATCEAYSSSAGRYGNHWWSRMREGTWVNNGDLRGGVKMGIGDCAAPRNDGGPGNPLPAAWSNGPVNAPAWRPAMHTYSSITCGSRSIPATLRPESVTKGWTARARAIVNIIRGPRFGWRSVGGAAEGARRGHIPNSYHYCGRAIDSYAPGVRAGTRATGAPLRASWRLANWAAHHAPALAVSEVIFYERIWTTRKGGWSRYTHPRGSGNTLQHRDHVHISVY